MKKFLQLLQILQLYIFLPFEISNGARKRALLKIRRLMVAANLL